MVQNKVNMLRLKDYNWLNWLWRSSAGRHFLELSVIAVTVIWCTLHLQVSSSSSFPCTRFESIRIHCNFCASLPSPQYIIKRQLL